LSVCYNVGKLLRGPVDEIDPEEPQTGSLDKEVVILHLGHHDASGLNISRVAKKKIEKFARRRSIEWIRAALDTKQFDRMKDQFGIPVKRTDKLAPEYVCRVALNRENGGVAPGAAFAGLSATGDCT
jgi:hypothetical protein